MRSSPQKLKPDGPKCHLFRKERRLTQLELEDKVGISQRTIQKIEHGTPVAASTLRLDEILPVDEQEAVKRELAAIADAEMFMETLHLQVEQWR